MPESPAARLIFLNQQAIAILRLGIPLDLGLGADPVARLREINDRLMTVTDRESSAESLIAKQSFPDRYAAIARILLVADDPAPIFESIAVTDLDREAAAVPIRQALAEPIVVAVLVYFCMIFFCQFTVPHLEAQYAQEAREPAGLTHVLILIKDAMPVWLIGFPVAVIGLIILWRKAAKNVLVRLAPGGGSYTRWLVAGSQSQRLSSMTATEVDETTALELARKSAVDNRPVRPIVESLVRAGRQPSDAAALNRLAKFYRFLAAERRRSYFNKAPVFIGIFLAGIFVFAYALATFLPWIEILSDLGGLGATGS